MALCLHDIIQHSSLYPYHPIHFLRQDFYAITAIIIYARLLCDI